MPDTAHIEETTLVYAIIEIDPRLFDLAETEDHAADALVVADWISRMRALENALAGDEVGDEDHADTMRRALVAEFRAEVVQRNRGA